MFLFDQFDVVCHSTGIVTSRLFLDLQRGFDIIYFDITASYLNLVIVFCALSVFLRYCNSGRCWNIIHQCLYGFPLT